MGSACPFARVVAIVEGDGWWDPGVDGDGAEDDPVHAARTTSMPAISRAAEVHAFLALMEKAASLAISLPGRLRNWFDGLEQAERDEGWFSTQSGEVVGELLGHARRRERFHDPLDEETRVGELVARLRERLAEVAHVPTPPPHLIDTLLCE